jgi:glycosyltransferase involved in cell wall biosynthesis
VLPVKLMKKKFFNTSIIITTYNRSENIFKIINFLQKQICVNKNFEIIISDSNSNDRLKIRNYTKQFLYVNSKVNHQAYKRNFGAKSSSGQNLIFIDDDCFPDKKFLFNHSNNLRLQKTRAIYCGLVKYIQSKNNHYLIRYRDERLITLKNSNANNIPEKNFISMNMAMSKKVLLTNKILFDERFRFYGFEDFEFADRYKSKGYIISLSKALIFHKDQRSFDLFLKKYHALAEFGITDISKINLGAAKKSIFYKIEKNLFIRLFLNLPFSGIFLQYLEKFLIFIDSKITFYFATLYKFGIFIAFLIGLRKRFKNLAKHTYLITNNSWYK